MELIFGLVGCVIAVVGSLDSILQRYNRAKTAEYAAQRDFTHLRNNQEQLKIGVQQLSEELDSMQLQVTELRVQLRTLIDIQREK